MTKEYGSSRRPDYKLKVKHKETNKSNVIGAAWINSGGSISIHLDLCTSVQHNPNILITLFPNDPNDKEEDNEEQASE